MNHNNWTLREIAALILILAAVFAYSLPTLTSKPRLFFDEGFVIEEAHNFAEFGVLDTIVAPNTFSGLPHIASSIGFSVTVPLAGVFKVFGFSIEAARAYALMWIAAFLIAAYAFARRHFGSQSALLSVALITTFAPLYGNGRPVMGDIPGFTYLLIALLIEPLSLFGAGVFLGLCLVARPSLYVIAVATFLVYLIYKYRTSCAIPLIKTGSGIALAVIASFLLYYPSWLSGEWWRATLSFIQNPSFGMTGTLERVLYNLVSFGGESTLIYFAVLAALIGIAYFLGGRSEWSRAVVFFSTLFCGLIFTYFLRSPGWFKYLLPLQMLIFFFLPSAIEILFSYAKAHAPKYIERIVPSIATTFAVAALVVLQSVQLLYLSDIYYSTDTEDTARYVSEHLDPQDTVATIHAAQVAMLFPSDKKYSYFVVNEDLAVGENPLEFSEDKRATYLVMPRDDLSQFSSEFDKEHMRVLADHYSLTQSYGRFNVFKLK